MSKSIMLSKNYLVSLSKNTDTMLAQPEPILQIIGFESCYYNPNTQIIMRLSDQTTFIDCSLIGSYCLINDKIVSKQNYNSIEFEKNDLVRLSDFYMKIDNSRICKLRVVVRKMHLAEKCQQRKGNPFQLGQYIQYCQVGQNRTKIAQSQVINAANQTKISIENNKKQKEVIKIEEDEKIQILLDINDNNQNTNILSQNKLINVDRDEKIQEEEQNKNEIENQYLNKNNEQKREQPNSKKPNQDQSLTLSQILKNQEGFFIGRLLRIKFFSKQTKDGPISILILGFVDRLGNIVRVNLAGKWALKQAKQVKKNRCYYISALQTIRLNRTNHPQIRLKDKQTKLLEINSERICKNLVVSAFYWDHEHQYSQEVQDDYSQNVDVVGMIQDVEQKTKYHYKHVPEGRQVIRVVVINRQKTVKISFWGHMIKVLQDIKLKKKMFIVFMDIKRKKNSYLDFTVESSFINLEEDSVLRKQLQALLPQLQQRESPKNIKQLSKILQQEALSIGKTYCLNLFLTSLDQNRLIFKLCQTCKQKVDLDCSQCSECKSSNFYYKYNCQVELADWSGSISCFLFDHCANKVLGMTAVEVIETQIQKNSQNSSKVEQKIQQCLFKQFEVGLQIRSKKIIIKSMRVIQQDSIGKYIKSNILQIRNKLQSDQIK